MVKTYNGNYGILVKLTDKIIGCIRLKAESTGVIFRIKGDLNYDFILANLPCSDVRITVGIFHSCGITVTFVILSTVALYIYNEDA